MLVNVQEWGCFSIFRRADDITRAMSKGGCLRMSKSGGVFQFSGGRMTSRRQCPRGGGCLWNVFTPPPLSGNPVSAPVICVKFRANQPLCPPNQSVPIRLWLYVLRLKMALDADRAYNLQSNSNCMGNQRPWYVQPCLCDWVIKGLGMPWFINYLLKYFLSCTRFVLIDS